MIYHCCDLRRREAARQSPLNGIDFIEVIDNAAPTQADRQRFLHIHLLKDPAPSVYAIENIVIEGPDVQLMPVAVQTGLPPQANIIVVELLAPGNFETHVLRFRRNLIDQRPPPELDPRLAQIEFSFKVECPSDFDCLQPCNDPDPDRPLPEIDYLARDTASFRRVMLERLQKVQPDAPSPHIADFRMALVDGLAVVADEVAQMQDVAHTDAYLKHLRSRISARRLGFAVDYALGEGRNARAFVHLKTKNDLLPAGPGVDPVVPVGMAFATRIGGEGPVLSSAEALDKAKLVFEVALPLSALYEKHNELPLYTWSDQNCCIPAGVTSATLEGHFPNLKPGDFIAFEELVGPRTGNSADRDVTNRPVVRLETVSAFEEGVNRIDPVTGTEITEITWVAADALKRPLCISAETDEEFGRLYLPRVSIARGNIVLADHGRTISDEPLGIVPNPPRSWAPGRGPIAVSDDGARPQNCAERVCNRTESERITPRYDPMLSRMPLTFAVEADPKDTISAARDLLAPEGLPVPKLWLKATMNGETTDYTARTSLIGSQPTDPNFVAEVEHDGHARLRFGDDVNGLRPNSGTEFTATYRVGLGPIGNVGEDRLVHVLGLTDDIDEVRNMTAGTGGEAPESVERLRQRAPFAYRRQDRAVTRSDHDAMAARFRPPEGPLQGTVTDILHTGSWHTTKISADRRGGFPVDDEFSVALREFLEPFRMAGRDLDVDPPISVPLEIDLQVCVCRDHLRGGVKSALLHSFSNRRLPDGTLGAFHPDRMEFGATVYLSPLIALAQSIEGVKSVETTVFRRSNDPGSSGLAARKLEFGRREIARLDNDPSHPNRGVLRLTMVGGR